ncbi:hypothetical protein ALTERO38_90102 [Alteromonas sp. 38]|nr:hypothetical protein ALTERO38_90102 [Alteromonas sp. 38]
MLFLFKQIRSNANCYHLHYQARAELNDLFLYGYLVVNGLAIAITCIS